MGGARQYEPCRRFRAHRPSWPASGLPWPFTPELNQLKTGGPYWGSAYIAASAFYLFLVHTFTAHEPFVRPSLFRDRNFTAGVLFISIVGLTYYASLALQPPYQVRSGEAQS
jgi:hypothetical protein